MEELLPPKMRALPPPFMAALVLFAVRALTSRPGAAAAEAKKHKPHHHWAGSDTVSNNVRLEVERPLPHVGAAEAGVRPLMLAVLPFKAAALTKMRASRRR
eukprot:2897832-Rhodomonas_salina.1